MDEQKLVRETFLDEAGFLTSPFIDYIEKFSANPDIGSIVQAHREEFSRFFSAIAVHPAPRSSKGNATHVTIIVSEFGGGHVTTGEAIAHYLEEQGSNYKVTLIREEQVTSKSDPLYVTQQAYKGKRLNDSEVYNLIFQGENDPNTASGMWALSSRLRSCVLDRKIELLEKAIPEDTDIILAVAHHHPHLAQLSYGSRASPVYFIHTDFAVRSELIPIIHRTEKVFASFSIPVDDASFFIEGIEELFPGGQVPGLDFEMIKNLLVPNKIVKKWKNMHLLGYPIRLGFVKETDSSKLLQIRKKLGILENSNVLLMTMGRNGTVSKLNDLIKSINREQRSLSKPLQVIIICGKNDEGKAAIEEQIRLISENSLGLVQYKVEGFLNDQQMSDYYNISDMMVSKPGGATTAEIMTMGVFLLCYDYHPWEEPNFKFLKARQQAEMLDRDNPGRQIAALLDHPSKADLQMPDWKSNIVQQISNICKSYQDKIQKPKPTKQ